MAAVGALAEKVECRFDEAPIVVTYPLLWQSAMRRD
jgi:hypothetical protein